MSSAFIHIHWTAVLLAIAAHFVLGGLWFALAFPKAYARALGIEDRPPARPTPMFLAGPLLCSASTIATTACLMRALAIPDLAQALALGLLVGVGYLGAMTVTIAINPLFPRPLRYAMVNAPMFVIGSLMSCAILFAMG